MAEQLGQRHIAFIFTREYLAEDSLSQLIREKSQVPYIANENLTIASAKQLLADHQADAVAFGKAYIANPDLYQRILADVELNPLVAETLYGSGAEGYLDYPTLV